MWGWWTGADPGFIHGRAAVRWHEFGRRAAEIGTSAPTLVGRWRAASLADVTLYNADGRPIASSFGADAPPALAPSRQTHAAGANPGQPQLHRGRRATSATLRQTRNLLAWRSRAPGAATCSTTPRSCCWACLAAGLVTAILVGTTISRHRPPDRRAPPRPPRAWLTAASIGGSDHHPR